MGNYMQTLRTEPLYLETSYELSHLLRKDGPKAHALKVLHICIKMEVNVIIGIG